MGLPGLFVWVRMAKRGQWSVLIGSTKPKFRSPNRLALETFTPTAALLSGAQN